jgi:hypothetical protein
VALVDAPREARLLGLLGHGLVIGGPCRRYRARSVVVARAVWSFGSSLWSRAGLVLWVDT